MSSRTTQTLATYLVALAWMAGSAFTTTAAPERKEKSPLKLVLPVTETPADPLAGVQHQVVAVDSSLVLSVKGEKRGAHYQWTRDDQPLSAGRGGVLKISPMTTNDVGIYRCRVITQRKKSLEKVQYTQSLSLMATYTNVSRMITVIGTPVGVMGYEDGCPGPYAGYVAFIKGNPDWGWKPMPGQPRYRAIDPLSTSTKIEYFGYQGDSYCDTRIVTIPAPPASSAYQFTIYFPNLPIPTGKYLIILEGFYP
jgi:hypothetical protein